jgi:diketogulonate reductase-like aldo/keto reductase
MGKCIAQSLNESLHNVSFRSMRPQGPHRASQQLGLKSLDLYLIHHYRLCQGNVVGCWEQMLQAKKEGLIKVGSRCPQVSC